MAIILPGKFNGIADGGIKKVNGVSDNPPTLWLLNNQVYPCVTSGLEAWWRFQETSGNTLYDSTANDCDGTLQGTNTFTTTAGKIRNCRDFSASSTDWVSVAYTSALNAAPISVAAWVRVDGGSGTNRAIASNRNISGGLCYGWILYATTANKFEWWTGAGSTSFDKVIWSSTFTEGTWYHVCGTTDGVTSYLYVNGSSTSQSYSFSANTTRALRIAAGQNEGSANFQFNGCIDDLRIYSRVLSANEVAKLAAAA